MNGRQKMLSNMTVALVGSVLCGCAAAPRVQFAAADSMDLIASSLSTTVEEFRRDLEEIDAQRRKAVVDAFITRVKANHADDDALNLDTASFAAALDRIDADRQVVFDRRRIALENLDTLREVSDGLRRVALESMSLDDEARRYLEALFAQTRKTPPTTGGTHAVPK